MNKTRKLLLLSSSFLAILIWLSNAYGQIDPNIPNIQCVPYNTEALKVVIMDENCFETMAYHLTIGYKIAGVNNAYVFMTK